MSKGKDISKKVRARYNTVIKHRNGSDGSIDGIMDRNSNMSGVKVQDYSHLNLNPI